jgi:hypothetical protein
MDSKQLIRYENNLLYKTIQTNCRFVVMSGIRKQGMQVTFLPKGYTFDPLTCGFEIRVISWVISSHFSLIPVLIANPHFRDANTAKLFQALVSYEV